MVGLDYVGTQEVHVPHAKRSGSKVISTFLSQTPFRSRAIIFLTSYFNGKDWRAFNELHSARLTSKPGGLRTEGLAIRQIHVKANIVGDRESCLCLALVCTQASINRAAGAAREKSSWGHVYNFSVDDFRLTVHVIKVFDGGLSLDRHSCESWRYLSTVSRSTLASAQQSPGTRKRTVMMPAPTTLQYKKSSVRNSMFIDSGND